MAAVDLTVQDQLALLAANAEPAMTAASSLGHTFDNREGEEPELYVDNGGGVDTVLTVVSARKSNFGTFPNKTVTVLAGSFAVLPRFWSKRFTNQQTGKLSFTLSATSNVTVAAVRPGMVSVEA